MEIGFEKYEAAGNDFIVVDASSFAGMESDAAVGRLVEVASKWCDRHFGIGADGILFIDRETASVAHGRGTVAKMTIVNSDGSLAEMCGNGIRCVGKFVYDKGLTNKKTVKIETLAGIKILNLNVKNSKVETVRVDMGEPILNPKEIPVNFDKEPVKELKIKAIDREFDFTCVSMGNPHSITIVENTKEFDIEKYGPVLETDEHFPKRSNIEFIEIIDENNIKMRVWERGAGETLACGTGACATAVACNINGLTERKVNIELLGGTLEIDWDEETNHVFMTGPATTVFEGEIDFN